MRLNANAIITLSEANTYLGIDDGEGTNDDFLKTLINNVSSEIETFIRGPVVVQSFTETYDGNGRSLLYLRQKPVISLATPDKSDIQYRINPLSGWIDLVPAVTNVLVSESEPFGFSLYCYGFPYGCQNIQIKYKAGYVVVPGEIKTVCTEKVAENFKRSGKGGGRLGLTTISSTTGVGGTGNTGYYSLSKEHMSRLLAFVMPVE